MRVFDILILSAGDDSRLAKLKVQYEGGGAYSGSSSAARGLLDALTSNEVNSGVGFFTLGVGAYSGSSLAACGLLDALASDEVNGGDF